MSTLLTLKTADSSLVSYVYPVGTNHYNGRDHSIDTITIHHAANGTGCGNGYNSNTLQVIFASVGTAGSCHYGLDSNGKVGQQLPEKYRSWCSDSRSNDMRAITIEVANDLGAPTWHVSDKAMSSLIVLCADICKRNKKTKMVWITDKTSALSYTPKSDEMRMTLHSWVCEAKGGTSCPEQYLTSKMQYIANEVNKRLISVVPTDPTPSSDFQSYIVKITCSTGVAIRAGAGVNYEQVGTVPFGGAYTIVEEKVNGTQLWGKLKSGAGWICISQSLIYATKI